MAKSGAVALKFVDGAVDGQRPLLDGLDLFFGRLQAAFGAVQGALFVDAGRLVTLRAAREAGLLQLDAGLGHGFLTAPQFVRPVILSVVVDPFRRAANLDFQIVQARRPLRHESVARRRPLFAARRSM